MRWLRRSILKFFHRPKDYDVSTLHRKTHCEFAHKSAARGTLDMKRVVAALIWERGKILICQRTRHQVMPLKWEFPGGKIEEGEQPRDALRRELDEELGINAMIGGGGARVRHEYPKHSRVELRCFVVPRYFGES